MFLEKKNVSEMCFIQRKIEVKFYCGLKRVMIFKYFLETGKRKEHYL